MRRQDIRLRWLARQGDTEARLRLGEAYLCGTRGMARNVPAGLGYLRAALAQAPRAASGCVAEHLQLQEILAFDLLGVLEVAAQHHDTARLKLAAWRLLCGERGAAQRLLRQAGLPPDHPLNIWRADAPAAPLLAALRALQPMDLAEVVLRAARMALAGADAQRAAQVLQALAPPYDGLPLALMQLVAELVHHAEDHGLALAGLPTALLECALERCAGAGDPRACHTLGRALAGLDCGAARAQQLVAAPQLRKAAAFLLRAADGGHTAAWLQLHRLCADYRSSVANPALARFCLEKAAQHGIAEAERRLGALALREATGIEAMERALALLHRAASKHDAHARALLQSLVLAVEGTHAQAQAAVAEVQRAAPLLAMRLRLARHFGLTRLEALTVDPCAGRRPWGLVVGRNPFVAKSRLAEPRAVPATSEDALECLARAALMFGGEGPDSANAEAPWRARALQQRRLFERLRVDEALFFACATSRQRDAMRLGTRWAQQQRQALQGALAH